MPPFGANELLAVASALVPSDSPRHIGMTRYHLPRQGVKKERCEKIQEGRDRAKRARRARAKQRRSK